MYALNPNKIVFGADLKTVLVTAAVTLIATPLIYMVARRVGAFLRENIRMWLEAALFRLGKWSRSSLAKRVSLRGYCRYGLGAGHARYLLIPNQDESEALEVDSAFVSLKLQNGAASFVYSGDVAEIQDMSRVRVIGDPGSGKSSLAKKMFRDACREAMALRPGHRLPILIELKRFTPPKNVTTDKTRAKWAVTFLREHVARVQGFEMGELFDSYVRGGGLFLILDGLDEVAGSDYLRVAATLRALSDRLAADSPHNSVVLTMRSQFHSQVSGHLETDFPPVFHVQPFSPEDIYVFLTQWPNYAEDRDKRAEILRLYNDLTDRPTLREMCGNPLVLAMYVSHDQHGAKGVSVDTRTAFYSKVVEELLVARRGRQLEKPAKSLLREQRETIFGRLAFEHMRDPEQAANSLSWTRAIDVVAGIYQCDRGEAVQRFRELAKETGLVSEERSEESYRFIHLTFCEFFAAKEAAEGREEGWSELMAAHHALKANPDAYTASRLEEVIPFALALLPRARRADALRELDGGSLVVGRCFLETQLYDHSSWAEYAAVESEFLTRTPSSSWDDAWLRRLHLFNVVLKDAEEWLTAYGRRPQTTLEDLFRNLVQDDRERLGQLFGSYAAVDAPAAMRLATATGVDLVAEQPGLMVESMSYPPFRAMVLETVEAATNPSDDLVLLVAEAGLRHRSVALECVGETAPEWLADKVTALDGRQVWCRWDFGWQVFQPSLYTFCLSHAAELARKGEVLHTSEFPGVLAISDVPAPGGLVSGFRFLLRLWSLALISMTVSFAVGWAPWVIGLGPFTVVSAGAALWLTGSYHTASQLGSVPGMRREIYTTLINLDTRPRRLPKPDRTGSQEPFLYEILRMWSLPGTLWLRHFSANLLEASRTLDRELPRQLRPSKRGLAFLPRPRSERRPTPLTERTPPTRQTR
ncbi:NACHT domain-containing protein [Streptomyces hyaluromycini]|uniref:NACHT domain-containing protein n=1 Tax=Streptomyces hyaluromycini TaxID=1377993 RepID=UPI000B5C7062|nr:NACHT domain-containing protein [Streptomyces hyaluromycini]